MKEIGGNLCPHRITTQESYNKSEGTLGGNAKQTAYHRSKEFV